MAHIQGRMNWEDLNWEKSYNLYTAYGQSKLANVLHAKELANRLEGTGITVYVLHPGKYSPKKLVNILVHTLNLFPEPLRR
jgi:NAD(P)-dependent dehydrogenase (short-subunit alcohol dehydrogenase family)